jgi:hypothetical protein
MNRWGATGRAAVCWLVILTAGRFAATGVRADSRELLVCGREKVFILDLANRDANGTPRIVWTWQARGRADLPAEYASFFRATDECKPVEGGRRILITASTGGVALVERASGAVVFYGRAANAHSAELLPGRRIAVAASHDPKGQKGDAVILFDVARSGEEIWRGALPSGHGVVWDDKRQTLWALGDDQLIGHRRVDWSTARPSLARTGVVRLPEGGGHDLFPGPGTDQLTLTTTDHCWIFDCASRTVAPHPQLADRAGVKSVNRHPLTGQIAFTQAEPPNWWTTRIQFLNPEGSCAVPGEQFYKVRWNSPGAK